MAKVPIKQAQFSKAMFRALKAVRAKRKNYLLNVSRNIYTEKYQFYAITSG